MAKKKGERQAWETAGLKAMTRSDWIAAIAAIGTLLALIPAYQQYFAAKGRKSKHSKKPEGSKPEPPVADDKPPGPYLRAATLTAMAFLLFVVELVIYSWIARLFKVSVDLSTMPLNWEIGFWSIFLVPGLLCFLAFINIMSTMGD